MPETLFLDKINIKTYPELIINYLKENYINSEISNLRSFYIILLDSINEDVKNSYLNRILKYLSSKEESTILILDDIKDEIYKDQVIGFFKDISETIDKNYADTSFYFNLLNECNFLFFDEEELNKLKELQANNKHDLFLYNLFLHACDNYKTNTPRIVGERLFLDAIALFDTTKLRNILLEASAELGNEAACTLYGTIIYDDWKRRVDIFLKGKSNPINAWGLAFIIEHYELTKDQFNTIKKELKVMIDEGNKYITNIDVINDTNPFHRDCTLTALKIYFYLANEKNYSKALCSVGKFFLERKVAVIENNEINNDESIKMGILYSNRAIKLGNIHAMQNVGTYYYKCDPNTNVKYKELLEIGAKAKDVLSNIYTARILIDEKRDDEAEAYLKFLAEENSSEALYRLGKLCEKRMQIDEAISYYEKAINNKFYSASIDLAKIYFTKYMDNKTPENTKVGFLLLAINLLEKNYNNYDDDEKEEVDILLKSYKTLI